MDYGYQSYEEEREEALFREATYTTSAAVHDYARCVGAEFPERAWILSPFDTWEANPFYRGPPVRHPEDDNDHYD